MYHYTSPYKEAAGLCEGERKRRSPTLSVSQGKEDQWTALNYHQLTEVHLPSYSWHLFVKSYSSLIGFLCFLSANTCFKVPFCGDILNPTITQKSQISLVAILSSIANSINNWDISQYQDKTVINHHHDTDLSFRSDSSGAVPSPGSPGWVRHHMSVVIDSSQFSQLAAGKLQGKIRTSISVVPNGRLGSREGPLQTWWYLYLVGLGLLRL